MGHGAERGDTHAAAGIHPAGQEDFRTLGSPLRDPGTGEDVSPEDLEAFHQGCVHLAQNVIDATEKNLHLLSPQARAFMRAAMSPALRRDDVRNANIIAANTLALRGVHSKISEAGDQARGTEDTRPEGALLVNSSVLVQSYLNALNKPPGLSGTKPQDYVLEEMRTKEALQRTRGGFEALGWTEKTLQDYIDQVGPREPLPTLTEKQQKLISEISVRSAKGDANADQKRLKGQITKREEQISQDLDKLTKLHGQLNQLQTKPTFGDKFKAFFQGGFNVKAGLAKAERDLENKITGKAGEIAEVVKNNPGIDLDGLLEKQNLRLDKLRQISDSLANAGVKDTPVEQAMTKALQKNEAKVEKLEQRKVAVESVRDAMRPAPHNSPPQNQMVTQHDMSMHNILTTSDIKNNRNLEHAQNHPLPPLPQVCPTPSRLQPRESQGHAPKDNNLTLSEDQIPETLKNESGLTMSEEDKGRSEAVRRRHPRGSSKNEGRLTLEDGEELPIREQGAQKRQTFPCMIPPLKPNPPGQHSTQGGLHH